MWTLEEIFVPFYNRCVFYLYLGHQSRKIRHKSTNLDVRMVVRRNICVHFNSRENERRRDDVSKGKGT